MKSKRSKWEQEISNTMSSQSVKWRYENKKLKYIVPETRRTYVPDFELPQHLNVYIEAKGYLRPEDRRKLRLVKKCNPSVRIILVFQRNNKIRGTKMTYKDWCNKYGFECVVGLTEFKEFLKSLNNGHNGS